MKRSELKADPQKTQNWQDRSRRELRRSTPLSPQSSAKRPALKRTSGFAASPAQRRKIKDQVSIVSSRGPCDPAHLWARGQGGCDHPDCVIPLTRDEHRAYDDGDLDLLPYMHDRIPELQHALIHAKGSLLNLIRRVSGTRWSE